MILVAGVAGLIRADFNATSAALSFTSASLNSPNLSIVSADKREEFVAIADANASEPSVLALANVL